MSQPFDKEAEQAVLGSCLIDPLAIYSISDVLVPEDFFIPQHAVIFKAMASMAERGEPIDEVTIYNQLSRTDEVGQAGGLGYVSELVLIVPSAISALYYARTVAEHALRRRLIRAALVITTKASDVTVEEDDLRAHAEAEFYGAISEERGGDLPEVMAIRIDRALQRFDDLSTGKLEMTGISTEIRKLDALTRGFQKGEMTILAARPGVGKSVMAAQFAYWAAVQRENVAFFSLEMTADSIIDRIICNASAISSTSYRLGRLSTNDYHKMQENAQWMRSLPITLDDQPRLSVSKLRSRARRLAITGKCDMLVLDYLQLLRPSTRRKDGNRVQEITEISGELKDIARELNIPVIALSQLSRASEQRSDHRPQLSDLRECVAGDQRIYNPTTGLSPRVANLSESATVAAGTQGVTSHVAEVWQAGTKPILCLTTATGKELRCSKDHRLYTFSGWKKASELIVGERILSPRRLPAPDQRLVTIEQARLLGYLVSDGSYCRHRSVSYTKGEQALVDEVARLTLDCFDGIVLPRIHPHASGCPQIDLTVSDERGMGRGPGTNPLINWLQDIGIHGQRGKEKTVPDVILGSSNDITRQFVSTLWAGDGCVTLSRERWTVKFVSTSEDLVRTLQHLLMRFGVLSVLGKPEWNTKSTMPLRTLTVGGKEICKFAEAFDLPGHKGELLKRAASAQEMCGENTRIDRLPLPVTHAVAAGLRAEGVRTTTYRPQAKEMHPLMARQLGSELNWPWLERLAHPDMFWDKVASVVDEGVEEMTFDLSVPLAGNFVVSDMLTHNSGAIEQDADVVLFIYRPDFNNPEASEEAKSRTKLIVAKNRNGSLGEIELIFRGDQFRFDIPRQDIFAQEGVA